MDSGDAETRLQHKRNFLLFLENEPAYKTQIDALADGAEEGKPLRLLVDLDDLLTHNPEVHRRLLDAPSECLAPFQEALEEVVRQNHPKVLTAGKEVHVGVVGEFGASRVSPRQLLAACQGRLVSVEGIVTKASVVRPKWVRSVHYCPATGTEQTREYRDVTAMSGAPTTTVFPQRDDEGNLLETQYGRSIFRDQQHLTIQELPETAPPGQLPRSCDVILEDDLVDMAKPGDRVAVAGVFKAVAPRAMGTLQGTLRASLVGNHVRQLNTDASLGSFTPEDVKNIRELGAEQDVLEQLAASLAPSIFGHDDIKRALVLLLLGGRERNLENGTHLRGDINCLMVGDPGVAKSQLLRAVMNVAPLAVSTTGRGSSGVGLTAAVTQDSDTGERRLEAGAMVLADRGLVCIDEFDKMNDNDRVAIHEVMEQQTVTIAKAGIHCSLNARCSVVAAANPLYGSYDHSLSVTRNINLPDSLLSRMDLLFIVLDNMTAERDRLVADHVIGQHRYRDANAGINLTDEQAWRREEENTEGQDTQMRVKYNRLLHGSNRTTTAEPLTTAFLKKYIRYAKSRYGNVELTGEAMELIGDFYAELRSNADSRALPVTVRTLETVIRLSSAAAKVRLSATVEERDVEVARDLVSHILNSDKAPEGRRSSATKATKRGRGEDSSDDDDDDDDDDGGDARARSPSQAPQDAPLPMDVDGSASQPAGRQRRSGRRSSAGGGGAGGQGRAGDGGGSGSDGITAGRINAVAMVVRDLFGESPEDYHSLDDFVKRAAALKLSRKVLEQALVDLSSQFQEKDEAAPAPLMFDAAKGRLYRMT